MINIYYIGPLDFEKWEIGKLTNPEACAAALLSGNNIQQPSTLLGIYQNVPNQGGTQDNVEDFYKAVSHFIEQGWLEEKEPVYFLFYPGSEVDTNFPTGYYTVESDGHGNYDFSHYDALCSV